jgi:hypothetical protein
MTTRPGLVSVWCAAGVGVAALALVFGPVPDQEWWVVLIGVIGVLSLFVRQLRWMAGLLPVSVLLMGAATRSAPTAALLGLLLLGYAFLVDFGDGESPEGDLDPWLGTVLPIAVLGSVAAVVTVIAVSQLPTRAWFVVAGPLAALLAFALVLPRPATGTDD